uniref:RDS/peripherin-like protein xRDS35 n=1 Tax=Haemonchus contortus TaxID=6289 RepID=A0A7I4XVQ6_HAECO
MVLLSCRASPFRRAVFRCAATLAFSMSTLVLCVLVSQEVFAYLTLLRSDVIPLLEASMPIINRKALGVAALSVMTICVQVWSANVVQGQVITRLRVEMKTASEKALFMCLAVAALLMSVVLCTVYAKEFKRALADGLLRKIAGYDSNPEARYIVDKLQAKYDCCGIGSAEDYEDLSAIDLYGSVNPMQREKTLQSCPHDETTCLYPLSCCLSVECTEYRLAELNIEGDVFHERWYKSTGCLSALLTSNQGVLDPMLPIWLLSVAIVFEIIALVFAQLTLTSYLTLAESGLSEADESVAWLLPLSYPDPEDIVQHLTDWAQELYALDEGGDEGEGAAMKKPQLGGRFPTSGGVKPEQVTRNAAAVAALK